MTNGQVAGGALEGAVLPSRQAKPEVLITHDVAQTAPRQTLKAKIVIGIHQRVPKWALLRRGQTNLDLGQVKTCRNGPMNGKKVHALVNQHAGTFTY